jgi:hypothetical protein
MPDESESGEQMKPEEQQEREIEALPGESFHARLKRISQMPRKEGESKFVKIRGGQFGPISFIPAPSGTEPNDTQSDEENEEYFKIEMERRRRQSSGPVTEEHFRPKER